ncbi:MULTISPECIES: hypothetical protein [Neisseria]|uniref:Uncharacterized protein n=1 Tax=Neisseria musculi TaxID=1815583 RepID=A0A7H1MDX4_9NEIS|nr:MULTISPECIES: hypothetical protein [Neisseria]MBF0804831.1 hypothetical protein [Neisseria sp. 19428wB4_WF04]QNT59839.1 hypothetical protein H7A79_2314 [Neisseria musculi]TFU39462.1 hypothetical protein E4T99_10965 [Neisseria sp. WF04]
MAELDEWAAKQPPHIREALQPYRKQLSTDIEKRKADLSTRAAGLGDDGTAVPKAVHNSLKNARDILKKGMADAIKEAESLFGQQ